MAVFPVTEVGQYGVLTAVPGAELPPNAWTKMRNVRVKEAGVAKMSGGGAIFAGAPISAYKLVPYLGPSGIPGWIFAGDEKVYVVEGGVYTNITRQTAAVDVDYTAEPEARWSGGIFNGKVVLYNGLDVPQYWDMNTVNKLVPLAGWPASTSAAVIRPYKNFLVALNVTKSGTAYPNLVKWSHAADPGFMPTSWDETDPTKDAGEFPLAETPGNAVDCLSLRDVNMVYKDDSIWTMQFVGGTFVMAFKKLTAQAGMPLKDMCVEYEVGRHLIYTGDDLVVCDGQQVKSVLGRFNRSIINPINSDKFANSFMLNMPKLKEVWICYASPGKADGIIDNVLIWNYATGGFSYRALGDYSAIGLGVVTTDAIAEDTWDTAVGTWDGENTNWNSLAAGGIYAKQDILSQLSNKTVVLDEQTPGVLNVPFTAELERTDLGVPMRTGQPPDVSTLKFCRRFWPRLYGEPGTQLEITLGSSMRLGDPTVWEAPQTYIIGTTEWIDCMMTGRVFALRIRSLTLASWELFGYDLEVERVGSH